ncbi:hypothetical protein Tco_1575886 [Tanacetum coccineum]
MAGFLSRLVTKICHVLTTVDEPRRNAGRTFKVAHQNLLTTRTMDDEDAPGLKALLTFKLHDEDAAEGFFGDMLDRGPQNGLLRCTVLERLNSHGGNFQQYCDKTDATGSGPTVKTTYKRSRESMEYLRIQSQKAEMYLTWPSSPSNESFAIRNMKFSNLVVKCLIKLANDLQSTIDETLAAARMLTPTGPTGQTHWGDSMANNPMPAAHSTYA